jgi:hypothetical protein
MQTSSELNSDQTDASPARKTAAMRTVAIAVWLRTLCNCLRAPLNASRKRSARTYAAFRLFRLRSLLFSCVCLSAAAEDPTRTEIVDHKRANRFDAGNRRRGRPHREGGGCPAAGGGGPPPPLARTPRRAQTTSSPSSPLVLWPERCSGKVSLSHTETQQLFCYSRPPCLCERSRSCQAVQARD